MTLSLEIYLNRRWEHAATLEVAGKAHTTPAELTYEVPYVVAHHIDGGADVTDHHALSVRYPLSFEWMSSNSWPPFILDFLPQGHARMVLAKELKLNPDDDSCELPLLLRAGGGPIGNMRVRQAWEQERERIRNFRPAGLTLDEVFAREDGFLELADRFAAAASGSSGVQGAWPKMLLTQSDDGLWYPDPLVPDENARDHAIVKWIGDKSPESALILSAEAPYLEVARWFGLRCGRPLQKRHNLLLMPRFDRRVVNGGVVRLGQESLVSAAGFAEFGHFESHETYLDVIRKHCDDSEAEITEYVMRDLLNLAMGNPDNHGRNTALQKDVDGTIRLSPLFDFCPMRLDPTGVRRSTRWACMQSPGGGSNDLDPDWDKICDVAAADTMPAENLKRSLADKTEALSELPKVALEKGVSAEVIDRAMARCAELSRSIGRLTAATHAPK